MKRIVVVLSLFAVGFVFNTASAQSEVKKEIKKEINVTEKDGEKVLTIKTTENGKTKTETFVGEKAEAKLKEMKAKESGTKKTVKVHPDGRKEIRVEKHVIKEKEEN